MSDTVDRPDLLGRLVRVPRRVRSGTREIDCLRLPYFFTREQVATLAAHYLAAADPTSVLASPIYADLKGLPPLLVHVGSDEVLLDDATRLAEHARAAGVDVELRVWDGMWHDFQRFAGRGVIEAQESIDIIGAFV